MTFQEASTRFFTKAFDFKGRASRSEFWWGYLLSMLLVLLAVFVDMGMHIGIVAFPKGGITSVHINLQLAFPSVVGTLEWLDKVVLGHDLKAFSIPRLVRVVLLVPTLSLFVRRFHDVNRSAVWIASLDVIRLCALPPEFLTTPRPLYHHLALRPEPNGFLVGCFSLAVSVAMIVWLLRRGTEGANHYGGGLPVGRKRVPHVAVPARSVQPDTALGFGELPPETVRQGPRKPRVTERDGSIPTNGTRRA